jgi:acyl dehydratase
MKGFIEQSSRFLKPVYAGDTLTSLLRVTDLVPGRTTGVVVVASTRSDNQRGELVMEGCREILIRRRAQKAT